LKEITIFNLIVAYKQVLDSQPKRIYHDVTRMNVTIDEQMSYIADFFRTRDEVTFIDLVAHMTEKIRIVVTIVAMLEMMKARIIGVKPIESEDNFMVYKVKSVVEHGTPAIL
jgi:segregation and condensation protein A